MNIKDIQSLYSATSQSGALVQALENDSLRTVFLQGLFASSAPLLFASVADRIKRTVLFILPDADEAGYFYHDLTQIMGQDETLFFPSSYRRGIE